MLVESRYKKAIKKYLDGVNVDLILYSTPPITLMGTVKYLKKKNSSELLNRIMLKNKT